MPRIPHSVGVVCCFVFSMQPLFKAPHLTPQREPWQRLLWVTADCIECCVHFTQEMKKERRNKLTLGPERKRESHILRSILATISHRLDPLFDSNHNNPWVGTTARLNTRYHYLNSRPHPVYTNWHDLRAKMPDHNVLFKSAHNTNKTNRLSAGFSTPSPSP